MAVKNAKNGGKTIFGKMLQLTLCTPFGSKIGEIALSRSVSEINVFFFHFTQRFKMAAKSGGKTLLVKKSRNRAISLCFGDKHVFTLCGNSRWTQKVVRKRFLGKVGNSLCRYPVGQKFC